MQGMVGVEPNEPSYQDAIHPFTRRSQHHVPGWNDLSFQDMEPRPFALNLTRIPIGVASTRRAIPHDATPVGLVFGMAILPG